MKYFALILIYCLHAAAQVAPGPRAGDPVPPAPPAVAPEDKCSIEGTVVNAATGEPLNKARLTLRPLGSGSAVYATVADAAGHFLVDDIDPGRYGFFAARNGFVSQPYNAPGQGRRILPLTLEKGQKLKDITFRLTPQGVITGRVLDDDGEPLANVMIQCLRHVYARGRKQLQPVNSVNTNDLGEYRIYGLEPGKYFVGASYRPPDGVAGAAEEGYAPLYYPTARSPESAAPVDVAAGAQVRGIDFTLLHTRTVRVRGRVVAGASSQPVANVNVNLIAHETGGAMSRVFGRTDQQGRFELRGVVPGSYVLMADRVESGQRESARFPITVGLVNLEGIVATLGAIPEITGRLIWDGQPPDPRPSRISVQLEAKDNNNIGAGGGAMVPADGTFKLQNIAPADYNLSVNGMPDGYYLKTVRFGDADVTDAGLDFSEGVTSGELTLTISSAAASLDGTVQDLKDQPAAGAQVVLIPEASKRGLNQLYKTAITDQNGRFSIKSIRPGEYKAFAWEQAESGAYADPEFLKPFESRGEPLTLKENGTASLQLRVIPAESTP